MSKNINLNDGYEEITINNDPNRVIRVNPTDTNIIRRYNETIKEIDELSKKYENIQDDELTLDEKTQIISDLDIEARKQLDYIVGSPIADIVFGNANCMSVAGGQTIYENFLDAYIAYMEPAIKAEYKKSRQRVAKYTNQAKKIGK